MMKAHDRLVCEVVQTEQGTAYRLDGKDFSSPSSADASVTGVAVNGWRFWSLGGELKPAREKSVKSAAKAPAKGKVATSGGKSKPKARGAKKSARAASKEYGCGACGETFATMKAATRHALTHITA